MEIKRQVLLITRDEPLRRQALAWDNLEGLQIANCQNPSYTALAADQPPALILLDYSSVQPDILTWMHFLDDHYCDSKRVCLLEAESKSMAKRFLKLGFDDYLIKPRLSLQSVLSLLDGLDDNRTDAFPVVGQALVLLVDDNADDREWIRRHLKKMSHISVEVLEAENGEQAFELLQNQCPDCLFLDHSMPGDSGLTVLTKALLLQPLVPVVFLTGQGSESLAAEAINAGALHYLSKSDLTAESLLHSLNMALSRKQLEQNLSFRDAELIKREAAQRELNESLTLILQATRSATWDYDPQSSEGAVAVNDQFYHMLGRPKGRTIVSIKDIEALVHPDDQGMMKQHYDEHQKQITQQFDLFCRMQHVDGSWRWIHVKGKIVERNASGEPLRALGTYQDVTAEKLAVEELIRVNQELERFAYMASHDLQEPLRMVVCFTALLKKNYGGQLDDQADQYIRFATDGATRMQQLIKGLLEYAQTGAVSATIAEVNLNDILESVISNLSLSIDEAQAKVCVGDLPLVMGNSARIQSLFQNLLGNALKYRRAGVGVCVDVKAAYTQSGCEIVVRDNGIGMKPEYCEKIFEPFQRLHHKDEYSGTGMGLSICRKIVAEMGGRLWAQSELGEGSRFIVSLPREKIIDADTKRKAIH